VVAERVRRFDPIFAGFADSLEDFTPFFRWRGSSASWRTGRATACS
jgi:hypothetical protein